jgi:hypothetical protein
MVIFAGDTPSKVTTGLGISAGTSLESIHLAADGEIVLLANQQSAYNATQRARLTSAGAWTVDVDVRAPIFYDSANTSFYVDPASTSILNTLTLTGTTHYINTDKLLFQHNGTDGYIRAVNAGSDLYLGGSNQNTLTLHTSNYTQSAGSMRAPIFYDSDNTAYFTDPASTSSLNGLNVLNDIYITRISNAYGYITRPNSTGYKKIQFAVTGGSQLEEVLSNAASTISTGDMRATIFYDYNNTAYYVDPASTSNFNTVDALLIENASTTSSRDKIRVYPSSQYVIGMQSGVTFGGLGDWAMTFQMNNDTDRGFWWGDDGHSVAQGAMALTTDGRLTVATSMRLGFGESDATDPGTNYTLEINGSLAATTKSFLIDHPTKEGMKLRYGSLEGPENGVYVRGQLTGNTIELPDYWTGLVDEDTITVSLTPIGKMQDLWVEDIIDNVVVVGGENVNCFYTVFAERKDVDKLVVEY